MLTWGDAPLPHAGPGEIRITVRAASVNPIDWKMLGGAMSGGQPLAGTGYLGSDTAGVVDEAVVSPLSPLAVSMWAQGSRVGVGELLNAYRALAAVDPSSRGDARLVLRVAPCSGREDLARFEFAFAAAFGAGVPDDPLRELGTIERMVLPHVAVPSGPVEEI